MPNVFRILADVTHTLSKCILIFAIHSNRSAEGVSLLTQLLYALVFSTRYLDLFWSHPFAGEAHAFLKIWNFFLKIFYIGSSYYILFLMLRVYGRTHEREKAWRFASACLAGSLVLSPIFLGIFGRWLWFSGYIVEVGTPFFLSSVISCQSLCNRPAVIGEKGRTVNQVPRAPIFPFHSYA